MNEPGTLERYSHLPRTRTFGIVPRRHFWDDARRQSFEQMWRDGVDVEEMSDIFEMTTASVYGKASQWKLGRRTPRGKTAAGKKRKTRRKTRKQRDSSGQRRFKPSTTRRKAIVALEAHDPRLVAGITIFPTTVVPASKLPRLLKSGHNSQKIGKMAAKGRWRGFPLWTLTLQERATCPRTCLEWATCYGNNMPFADRIVDDGTLTRRLWGELAAHNAETPAGFVVRLHILGDFFSVEYVDFWRQALADFPALNIFGFTARRAADPIGAALIKLAAAEQDRFAMRFSGAGYETHCSEVVDKPEEAIGTLCPAQTNPDRSCATCGLCWTSTNTISFIRH